MFEEINTQLKKGVKLEQRSPLNFGQCQAIVDIVAFLREEGDNNFHLLSGAAGTGKTFCVQALVEHVGGKIIFTAPTNKATKVLRTTLTTQSYRPECRTIYSLLGLKMAPNGAVKQLTAPDDPIDLKGIKLVVVDEASMVNGALMKEIERAVDNYNLKFLFLGDKNQLPPVNEKASLVWEQVKSVSKLVEVMRFDNKILELAERIKTQVNHPAPSIRLQEGHAIGENPEVVFLPKEFFKFAVKKAAKDGDFSNPNKPVKAIAWRNITVATLNLSIRACIFDNAHEQRWLPGDRIILTGPAMDKDGKPIGSTDDEGTVERVETTYHPNYHQFQCYSLSIITDENKRISLWVLHDSMQMEFLFEQNRLAEEAKITPRKWKLYWEFADSFHQVQHGYAITAHRAQGSTYDSCYVVWNDILINRNRGEAFRCLYVAATRPKRKLILGSV